MSSCQKQLSLAVRYNFMHDFDRVLNESDARLEISAIQEWAMGRKSTSLRCILWSRSNAE